MILADEFAHLCEQGIISENIFNFLVRFLEERHTKILPQKLKEQQKRILFLTTSFYRHLLSGTQQTGINYEKASYYTRSFCEPGGTVFEKFDKILVVACDNASFRVAAVDNQAKCLVIYDPNPLIDATKNHMLANVFSFLNQESQKKRGLHLNPAQWDFYCKKCAEPA